MSAEAGTTSAAERPPDLDAITTPLDAAEREDLLRLLLQRHPSATVTAMDGEGRSVDLPASIQLTQQHFHRPAHPLEGLAPDSYPALLRNLDRAHTVGAGSARIALATGVPVRCYLLDLRETHGVMLGLITADGEVDVTTDVTTAAAVLPRSGHMSKDAAAIIQFADERICRILGFAPAELIGHRSSDFIHPEEYARAVEAWMEMLRTPDGSTRMRARHRRKDGSWVWLELTNKNQLSGPERCVLTEMLDVSEEMAALENLRQREELLARLTEALPSGVLHIDRNRNVVYTNAQLHRVLGVGTASTFGAQLATVVAADRAALYAGLESVLTDGRDADLELHVQLPTESTPHRCAIAMRALTDAAHAPMGAVLCIDDVTEASALRAELERRATTDELTGCLNRAAVLDSLRGRLGGADRDQLGTALVFLDLDGFKTVNDTFGHLAGDSLLASVAARLRGALRGGDVAGRLGGDEFVVVASGVPHLDAALQLAFRISDALVDPLEVIGGLPTRIRASIGVAWTSEPEVTALDLTAAADRAMFESKRAGTATPVSVRV